LGNGRYQNDRGEDLQIGAFPAKLLGPKTSKKNCTEDRPEGEGGRPQEINGKNEKRFISSSKKESTRNQKELTRTEVRVNVKVRREIQIKEGPGGSWGSALMRKNHSQKYR